MKIVVEKITPRIQFVFDCIARFRNDLTIELFTQAEDFPSASYHYIRSLEVEKGLIASDVLYDEKIEEYDLSKDFFRGEECLAFDRIVDPLAAIFYHLTRMEEYNDENYDAHNRFRSEQSFVFKMNWMRKLMVERWIDVFLLDYEEIIGETSAKKPPLEMVLTVDIDNTFAFKWKPFFRIIGSYFRDFSRLDFPRIIAKTKTLLKLTKDPYDTYDYIKSIQSKGIRTQLFWLLGDLSPHDRNVSNKSVKHLNFIHSLSKDLAIGLHPSYVSNINLNRLKEEKTILEKAIQSKVIRSRQHFLKLNFPSTYQRNMEVGLEEDFTMGFGDVVGFRVGTLQPFPFFDLTKNQQEDYLIHPFAYMDGTFRDYMHVNQEEAKEIIAELVDEAQLFGGPFIAIWHNESLSDWHNWKGWKSVLEYTIQKVDEVND